MRNGFFAWPNDLVKCAGYTRYGEKYDCDVVFMSVNGGQTQRCQACRKIHKREYHRKFKKKRV